MSLPRFSSQSSLQQVVPQQRTPASQRLQQQQQQQPQSSEPQFLQLPSASSYQPSRRREEARALQNLRRRVHQLRDADHDAVAKPPSDPLGLSSFPSSSTSNNHTNANELDNRPLLLQKILLNRPVSVVLDISEIRTAWQDSDFITDSLCWHNVYRQRHNSPPLSMSSELCHLAQTWANHLAHTNRFYYRNDKDIGQNLFCRPDNALQNDVTGHEVSTYWYSAVKQYDYGKEPDVLHANVNAGHFTQLVWAGSKQFGVGKARSRSGKIVVVAHYAPAGNQSGAFHGNVMPPTLEFLPPQLHHQLLQQLQAPSPHTDPPTKFVISSYVGSSDDSADTNSTTNHSQST